ncbi:hemolysin-type calcium-binding region [Vibrio sp. JCM 19236]|nr:hemolysin-type calcium-binding region [Vibrio sp. JCM 19236]
MITSTDTENGTGGDDVISLGAGQDHAIAGVGNDEVRNASGESIIIGDDGFISNDAEGRYIEVSTGNTEIGGDDLLVGGSDRDIIFGGYGSDEIYGGAGHDILGGDGSLVTRDADGTIVFEAIDLFTGGSDTLDGGAGEDRMQGHYGNDFFFANFSEDVLVGEYGRFTFVEIDGEVVPESIISLANGELDLIRVLQTGLFSGYADQVYQESAYREVGRERAEDEAETEVEFTEEAELAFIELGGIMTSTGAGGASAPSAPTANTAPQAPVPEQEPEVVPQEATEPAAEDATPVEAAPEAEAQAESEQVEQQSEELVAELNLVST